MRLLDPLFDAESAGSTVGDQLEVSLWRGSELLSPSLDVGEWGFSWDANRSIQGQGSLEVIDPTGKLSAYSLSDPLGAGGSRMFITWVSGTTGTRVPLGWWRIRQSEPDETWIYVNTPDGKKITVVQGNKTVVDIDDETSVIFMERLDAETVKTATCLSEVRRLLQDICTVSVHPDVVDRAVPRKLVYDTTPEGSRLSAITAHLTRCLADYRMGGDGTFEVVPQAGTPVDLPIRAGGDGILASFKRVISDDTVYNGVVSTATTDDGRQLIGRAFLEEGDLRWGGPFGRRPLFHNAVSATQAGVMNDAQAVLANRQIWRDQIIQTKVLAHPGLQIHDVVQFQLATTAGDFEVAGRVDRTTLKSANGTPAKAMDVDLVVPSEFLEMVADRIRKDTHG